MFPKLIYQHLFTGRFSSNFLDPSSEETAVIMKSLVEKYKNMKS